VQASLNLKGPDLNLKSTFIHRLSAQSTLEMCVTGQNRKKFTKTPYFGGSRSFKVIDDDISKKLVSSACYVSSTSVPIWNHFHITRANNGRITPWGCPSFSPFIQWHEILSKNTEDSKLSYGENSNLYLTRAPIGTRTC